jgi:CheY-specific phosphatase CheX
MTALYSKAPLADFILSEAPGQRSRDNIMVLQTGDAVPSGTVLTVKSAGVGQFLHDDAAEGNSTIGTITVGAAAINGIYLIEFTSPTAFRVVDPAGVQIGTGTLGTAFNVGGLTFTLTAGATPHVAGDMANIDVTPAAYTYGAATGAESQDAVLYGNLPEQTGSFEAVAFTGDCEVKRTALIGLTAAGEITLATRGIKVRGRQGIPGISTPAL